ncbi:HD-GYP domain-containing protein [Clostridium sp.]|uniref:HD-GYP domain-containing protein n=1 Tax=Clostridium sp. TaxID=1506 RepID=UPI002901F37B|nr:HD-GYP domain-containing protein [Clostridium sp.]MDU2156664.1 HD-GYP domain-containing protein [Clostridium sp.]
MNIEKKFINVRDLKIGMVIASEILSNGTVLVGKGITLNQQMLDKLNSICTFDIVEIYTDEKDNSKEKLALKKAEKTLNNISIDVKLIFDNAKTLQTSNTNEINEYAKKLSQELKLSSSVLKNIVLHGSDEDCIYRHSVNVASLSYLLGKWHGLNDNKLHSLIYASLLHDFGKTKLDEDVIKKEEPLSKEDFEIIKTHPTIAYNEIKKIPFISQSVLYAILMHHERCDGTGYPLGLKGNQIHDFAKIIAIADTFDAINSNRTYKKRKRPLEALKIIKDESLNKLDYSLCCTFLEGMANFYIGQTVLLNNKSKCKIIKMDLNNISSPHLLSEDEFIDLSKTTGLYIEQIL